MMIELQQDIFNWIDEHCNEDVAKLRLRYHKTMTPQLDFAILQIECRQRASKKIPDTLKSPQFIFPTTLSAEQCTSDLLSKFHAKLINDGDTIVDLTSGLGIDVFHFAQKACHVTAVEMIPNIASAIAYNANVMGLSNIDVVNADCREYINETTKHYDVAFIDPARRGEGGKRLFALCDCSPDVPSMLSSINKICDKLIVKMSPMLDVSQILRELPSTTDIYIIGTHNECKEVVAIIDFKIEAEYVRIHAVTLYEDKTITVSYLLKEEENTNAIYDVPVTGGYLYEPYPSVMKASPIKLLSKQYGVGKLHANTHLYVSQSIVPEFPGDIFNIEHIIPFTSKEIKGFNSIYPQINVAVRNFILSAEELKKKLKVKDGGGKRVVGCTLADGRRVLLIVSRL